MEFLYYRYVRTDKDLTMQQIATMVGQDERTMRRRHRLGIARLTRLLVSLEQEHRRLDLLQRLRMALPTAHAPSLIGTETLFVAAWRVLTGDLAPTTPCIVRSRRQRQDGARARACPRARQYRAVWRRALAGQS